MIMDIYHLFEIRNIIITILCFTKSFLRNLHFASGKVDIHYQLNQIDLISLLKYQISGILDYFTTLLSSV